MNYDRFIHSKDIRDYLQQIGYSFAAPEAAFLVWQCRNATLKEKFAAWREIIETMPNCSLTRREKEPIAIRISITIFCGDILHLRKHC